ncbi:hypothetical protein BVG79_p1000058 (plasmid) [Ketogulonicigenium robustum]|uniref:Uncharacterized protein n=1 Tax=Ketogulonicigenium robustum TaxID=92947 RepID=A0A1W6P3D4_9RHOB|nr:hypothetical protein BVG79_p1000058 [Ketogulonicigenium robustum]
MRASFALTRQILADVPPPVKTLWHAHILAEAALRGSARVAALWGRKLATVGIGVDLSIDGDVTDYLLVPL